jgi:hypothetical protein
MARRQRSQVGGLSLGSGVTVILSLIFIGQRGWLALAVLWTLVLVLWLAFFKKTQCDVETKEGTGCGRDARGRLRSCGLVMHKRAKRDALWRVFGLRNPAIRYRIMWAQERSSYGRVSPQAEGESEPKVTRPLYDGTGRLRPPPSATDLRQGVERRGRDSRTLRPADMPHLTTRVAATVLSQLVLYSSRVCMCDNIPSRD